MALQVQRGVERPPGAASQSRNAGPELGFKGPWHLLSATRGLPMGEPGGAGSEPERGPCTLLSTGDSGFNVERTCPVYAVQREEKRQLCISGSEGKRDQEYRDTR